MATVWLGQRTGLTWLRYADPLAALVVAAVVIWVGARLGKRTLDALLDAAPAGLQERVASAVEELEGVLSTERVRVRRAGNRHFVDVTISVPRSASFEQVHAISDAVERRVGEIVPADVMVHMEPRAAGGRAPVRRHSRGGAAPGPGHSRTFRASARRAAVHRAAPGSGRALEPARGASPRDRTRGGDSAACRRSATRPARTARS